LKPDAAYGYSEHNHSAIHHLFRERWRWCNRVANYFDTVALTHHKNGGANDLIVEYWNASFNFSEPTGVRAFNKLETRVMSQPIKHSDVSHFVFQFTQWMRSRFPVPLNGKITYLDSYDVSDFSRPDYVDAFEKYFASLNIKARADNSALGVFHEGLLQKDVDTVKKFLQGLEQAGIKTYVLCWPWDHCKLIENDQWMNERFIKFNHNGKTYRCIEEMMQDTQGLSIETDFDFFDEPPIDGHPSFRCHQIIADNVIKFIEGQDG
jgi:hypothetical protein